jgi:hypothetical protein
MPGIVRCEVLPLPDERFSFRIDGRELAAWNFAPAHKRPFLFPVNGPVSGESLTRMGHPGAPNHDHHDSVWFAHHKVLGIDFWGDTSAATIRQVQWLAIEESDEFCAAAVRLGWFDGHDARPLIEQDLILELRPLSGGEYTIELSSLFQPAAAELELQQTNFGIVAVRVARSLSRVFGAGLLTSSTGVSGEKQLFDQPAEWMCYSGPMPQRLADGSRIEVTEGITLFSHPSNVGHPPTWHVRDDGWMGPSLTHAESLVLKKNEPLSLSYLLHAHAGGADAKRAAGVLEAWAARPQRKVRKSTRPHHQFEIV